MVAPGCTAEPSGELARSPKTISDTSMNHCNLVQKFYRVPKVIKIPDAKAAVDKERKKSERSQRGNWTGSATKKRSPFKHKESKKESPLFFQLMDICHLKNAELEPKLQKCKGRVVLRGDIG